MSHLKLFCWLLVPFYLNDFANIYVEDYRYWLAIDWIAVKLLPLFIIGRYLSQGRLSFEDLGLRSISFIPFVVYTIIALAFGLLMDNWGYNLVKGIYPASRVGSFPEFPPYAYYFDITCGLLFVAIVEEVLFRGFATKVFGSRGPWVFYVLTSLVFATIHWSGGVGALITTGVIGAFFMLLYRRCGSTYPLIVAHYFVNLYAFWG